MSKYTEEQIEWLPEDEWENDEIELPYPMTEQPETEDE